MLRLAYSAEAASAAAIRPAGPGHGGLSAAEAGAIVAGILARDAEASRTLWCEFAPLVRRLLRRSLGPGHEIDDATQDVFCRLVRSLGGLRDPGALRSFVIGVALRVAGAELRKRHALRWFRLTPSGDVPELPNPAADHEMRAAVSRFYALLDRVGTDDRHCFVLRHLEELELADVAAALDVSLATVKRRLQRVEARVAAMADADPILSEFLREHAPRWSTSLAKRVP